MIPPINAPESRSTCFCREEPIVESAVMKQVAIAVLNPGHASDVYVTYAAIAARVPRRANCMWAGLVNASTTKNREGLSSSRGATTKKSIAPEPSKALGTMATVVSIEARKADPMAEVRWANRVGQDFASAPYRWPGLQSDRQDCGNVRDRRDRLG